MNCERPHRDGRRDTGELSLVAVGPVRTCRPTLPLPATGPHPRTRTHSPATGHHAVMTAVFILALVGLIVLVPLEIRFEEKHFSQTTAVRRARDNRRTAVHHRHAR